MNLRLRQVTILKKSLFKGKDYSVILFEYKIVANFSQFENTRNKTSFIYCNSILSGFFTLLL